MHLWRSLQPLMEETWRRKRWEKIVAKIWWTLDTERARPRPFTNERIACELLPWRREALPMGLGDQPPLFCPVALLERYGRSATTPREAPNNNRRKYTRSSQTCMPSRACPFPFPFLGLGAQRQRRWWWRQTVMYDLVYAAPFDDDKLHAMHPS